MVTVFLGLGSNSGDTENNLRQAIIALKKWGTISKISSLYRTEPVGLLNQPWFLNQVVRLDTALSAKELLKKTQEIENSFGRERIVRWGPRTIDIDLLLYDNLVMNTPALTLPHPRMSARRFVLAPLAEIAPTLVEPVSGTTIAQLLAASSNQSHVEKI